MPGGSGEAMAHYQRAAAYPELFYGQLALERLGRAVPAPPPPLRNRSPPRPSAAPSTTAAWSRRCASSASSGRPTEQALFVQALAKSLDNDADRALAIELGQQLCRQDLAGVGRADGAQRRLAISITAKPIPPARTSARTAGRWSTGSPARKARSTLYAISHAGALGTMQLMRGTAREQAGKMRPRL